MTGVAYSLFAGQPLTILGSTGPVLVFEKILFKFCKYVFTTVVLLRFHVFIIYFSKQLSLCSPAFVSAFLFHFRDYKLSYLSLRTCIGLWTALLCLVLVATDASSLVCYITRFTEEAFAALICLIFIYEALEKLFHLGEIYPFNTHTDLDQLTLV